MKITIGDRVENPVTLEARMAEHKGAKIILHFSGGKDSTATLLLMLQKGITPDKVLFVDTTKEFPDMYKHIMNVERLTGITVERVPINFDYWFSEHVKTKGINKGKRGYGFPDFRNRWCTALKRDTAAKIVRSLTGPAIEVLGIAADERDRALSNADRGRILAYPLIDYNITEEAALSLCYSNGLHYNGLYQKLTRVSCWCCPLKRMGELRTLHREFPELWDKLLLMENKSYRRFRTDYSVTQLTERFNNENNNPELPRS